jgi:NOL1/NOP2/fmu family ribosome biogenesis protein
MFRRHPETRDEWNPESPAGCAKRQGDILDSAAVMLRPGGRLVYSTCTLNKIENEGVVEAFLLRHPDFELMPFELPGLSAPQGMLTIYPHRIKGEGHFVALLRRKGDGRAVWQTASPKNAPDKAAMKVLQEFLPGQQANLFFGNELRYCPDFPELSKAKGVTVLRSGLHLGTVKGKVFIPDHAWAVSNAAPAVPRVHLTEEEARLYLNGQVIPADGKGWVLACYAGLPLGWGKVSEGMMKNHYPKGLRR